jgi:NADH:ubiquinone oxidoreductase subunit E
MEDVAAVLEMNPVEVNEAAAFYTMYNIRKPVGRYHIQVCRNISCSLLGRAHHKVYGEVLNIKTGETTRTTGSHSLPLSVSAHAARPR